MSKQADFSNDDSPRSDEVSQVIMALFTIRSIDEIYRLVKREQTLLLSDTVDQRMSNALEQARKEQDDDFAHGIEIFLDLLRNCREIGIEAAVGKAEMRLPDNTDSEEPTTLGDTLTTLDIELIDQRHCSRRDVLALLERKQAILLTDAADRVLTYYIVGIEIPGRTRTDPSPFEPCRTLLRRMRQVGIAQAWEEYIQMTEGKDWNSVRLFELFEEWIDVSTFDESDFGSVVSKKQKRDFFRAKREGYRFLVTHPELLDPRIDSVLEDQLAAIDWKADSDRSFADPSKLELILNHKIATVLAPISRENNIVELLEGQMLLRDVRRRGGTIHVVQDAYVNAYGGFVLDLPQYLDDVLQELDTLLLAEEPRQTAVERLSLLRDAFNRANGRVPIEIMVEPGYEINRTSFEIPNIDPFSAREAAIEQYTRSLTAYTRDRYPYQWALCQKKLGSLYAERITGNATDNQERAIQYYEAALQAVVRNVSNNKSMDETANNLTWVQIQDELSIVYSDRKAGDRIANLTRAIQYKDAKLDTIRTTLAEQRKERSGAWVHVASHAQAEPADPTKCFILLSDNERLTLAELQREQLLEGLRGFVASGCATALGDLERAPDELGSFAAGILQAGAPCAVATQWSVSDKATFLLMRRFMQELLQESTMSPARALREAAHWLRTAKQEELQDFVKIKLRDIATPDLDQASSRDAVRGVGVSVEETDSDLSETTRVQAEETLSIPEDTEKDGTHNDTPYWHAVYWASTIVYGV